MKVQNITDIEKFFKVIDQCKGKDSQQVSYHKRIEMISENRPDIGNYLLP